MAGSAKTIYSWSIVSLWLVFIAYWAVSALGVKKSIGGARVWWREAELRVGAIVLILLALRIPAFRQSLRNAREYAASTGLLTGALGVALCAFGIGLAIWARVYLGSNWGMPMSRKEGPELVTSGPYALVRHPIYAGMILAMFGSMLAQSIFWTAPLVLGAAYFLYSAWSEEKLMTEQFPNQYSTYKRRTKMFVPYIF